MIWALLALLLWPSTGLGASLWLDTVTPATVDANTTASSLELGTEFTADMAGTVTAIRFYKASTNTGPHRVSLWNGTGVNLATVTVASETTSGWQAVLLPTPISIVANAPYVVSYHTENGHWSRTANYFSATYNAAPLHGLAGHYLYGTASAYPTNVNLSNYWVDVVFAPALPGPAGPTVVSLVPRGDPIALAWTANGEADLAGYKVYARFPGGLWGLVGTTVNATATIGSLILGATYEFAVTAFDRSNNESGKSNVVSATIK